MSETNKLVRPDLDDGGTLNRREVIEILANELMGHIYSIKDVDRILADPHISEERAKREREFVAVDVRAAKTLRTVARKLGVYEEVEEEAS